MSDQSRLFEAGPDPFGRTWRIQFRWLQTAISIRHGNTIDVKFFITSNGGPTEEKVIALPHPALLDLVKERGRRLSDPLCMRIAAEHLKHMIETSENMDQTLVTVSPEELFAYDQQLQRVTVPTRA